ncbi:hypothetical protein LGL55_21200 [Clostridium tagluense]|uniref:hypothetical protein n=1 Tax=Clostridium tagluense TaxID=360422 RepID=UPI001CF4943E|nr:hypothetical protein [Clostridium tagluense]MCB2313631.1 hypothetical protein [Clostridium tagluense]MCB2318468.1 hypothetical protein [Clostridium tagluense]MCB2323296.1 hypothetical protein [Clostridium tagluense]MCB2328239.1 hypothetical protein [Clostridium tagluense]MCB2332998.1 hypothetical protein [Clostridium tagluense]
MSWRTNKSELNTTFVGQVERWVKKPMIDTLQRIVNALEITFEDLFSFEKDIIKHRDSTIIEKICFELKVRTCDEQTIIYNFIKQILKFKDIK